MEINYSEQRRREETFQEWNLTNPSGADMAKAGFIYQGPGDAVECYACGVRICGWEYGSDPKLRHLHLAPGCPLMADDDASSTVSGATGYSGATGVSDDSGLGDMQRARPSHAATRLPTIESSEASTVAGGRPSRRRRPPSPAPPRYKQVEERKKSFYGVDWPTNLEAQPDKLVKAGLYYIGPGDRVKCAFCGGKLKNWEPKDSAIEEHIRHFPDCTFVQNIEKQTEVLSKNIRSKRKTDNCISSDELIKQYEEERQKAKKPSQRTMWRKTLKKMGYSDRIIRNAEKRCKDIQTELNLETILGEIHNLEKEQFFGTSEGATADAELSDEGVESGNEEMEEEETRLKTLDVDERVKELQQELRSLESEKEQLQNMMVCKICLSNPSDTLFLTCRHFCTCHACADRVRDCPVCRQLILGTVDVFIA